MMKIRKVFALLLAVALAFSLAACSNSDEPSSSVQAQNEPTPAVSVAAVSVKIEDVASRIIPYYPDGVEFEYTQQNEITGLGYQEQSESNNYVQRECYLFDVTHEGEKVSGVAVGTVDGSIWIWHMTNEMWLSERVMGLHHYSHADEPRQKQDTVTNITSHNLSTGGINLYFAYLDTIPELTAWNIGSVFWYETEQRIEITATKNTGSASGTPDGPTFILIVSWASGEPEIISIEFKPAPVYSQPSQVLLSGETISIEPDRLIEIAEYFKALLLEKWTDAQNGLQEHDVIVFGEAPSESDTVDYKGLTKEEWEEMQTQKASYEALTDEEKVGRRESGMLDCEDFVHLWWEHAIDNHLIQYVGSDQFSELTKEDRHLTIYSFADYFSLDLDTLVSIIQENNLTEIYPVDRLITRYDYMSQNGENYAGE
jgi:hypothetical protein